MATPLSMRAKEEQHAVIEFFCGLKVYQRQKSIEDFQNNMGTVLCYSILCMNGLPCLKMVAPVSLMVMTQTPIHVHYRREH
jgi:hypothetical protein